MAMRSDVCAVISARNEEKALPNVLRQIARAGIGTSIVVANGCTDRTARVAAEVAAELPLSSYVIDIPIALGLDVPRAVGAYNAVRSFPQIAWLVFVDGDWKGSFGPMLADFIDAAKRAACAVQWVGNLPAHRFDQRLWRSAIAETCPELADLQPSVLPLLIHRRAMQHVSAWWLHHPGVWAACCLKSPVIRPSCRVDRQFAPTFVGNPVRNAIHQQKMAETLIGDALEGCALLRGERPTRRWKSGNYEGYHPARRVDLLREWQAVWTVLRSSD